MPLETSPVPFRTYRLNFNSYTSGTEFHDIWLFSPDFMTYILRFLPELIYSFAYLFSYCRVLFCENFSRRIEPQFITSP